MNARALAAGLFATLTVALVGCGSDYAAAEDGTVGGSASGVCAAVASWKDTCTSAKTACDDTIASTCSDVTRFLNASVLEAAASCLSANEACGGTPTSCLARSIAGAKKTAAHEALARGFCGCLFGKAKSACLEAMAKDDGPSKAAVAVALPLSDALADAITESCTTTPGCGATFGACAQGVVTKKIAERLSADAATCVAKSILSAATAQGSAADCTKKTCEDYAGACGAHDDACGGTIDCGQCTSSCTPKTCAQLGKTCGTHDDGCGGTASCGPCATGCSPDGKEPNNDRTSATSLGAATDYPETDKTLASLSLPDGDEDWFRLSVEDAGFGGNPIVTVTAAPNIEIGLFYSCNSLPDYSSCSGGGTPDNTIGKGCRATGRVAITTDCKGLDESGTAYVRLRKLASDGACSTYTLAVKVD